MTDTSFVDDDDLDLGELNDGESDEGQGTPDADEGQGEGQEDDAAQVDEGNEEQEGLKPGSDRRSPKGRIRELATKAKTEKERADRFERELEELRRVQAQPRGPSLEEQRHQAAIEAERLSLMSPEERADYRVAQMEQRLRGEMQQTRLQLQEQSDKDSFRTLTTTNPLARRYATDVERVVAEQRARGLTVSRETALKFVIGEQMFAKAGGATAQGKKRGAARIASQQGRPSRPGGEAPSERAGRRDDDSESALERRLAGQNF